MRNKLSYVPIGLGVMAIVFTLPLVVLKLASPTTNKMTVKTEAAAPPRPTVAIFPASGSYSLAAVGKSGFAAGAMIDSAGEPVQTINLIITFDPQILSVLSLDNGKVFDKYTISRFDNKNGEIDIVAVNLSPRPVTGIVAGIKLLPKQVGQSSMQFVRAVGVVTGAPANFVIR